MASLTRDGYEFTDFVLTDVQCEHIRSELPSLTDSGRGGVRNLIAHATVARLLSHERLSRVLRAIDGEDLVAVKATLFDKTADANWRVQWHQDRAIAVKERRDADGYGPWSVKAGTLHVEPPAEVLARMLAIRVHLDPCGPDNGPLRVIPRSHRLGKLSGDALATVVEAGPAIELYAPQGALLLMRPLLVHASSPARLPEHRRVLHIELAPANAIAPLQWQTVVPLQAYP